MVLIFLIIIWTPAVVVIWCRLLQAIRFWQANEYTWERFYYQVRHHLGIESRSRVSLAIHLAALLALASVVIDPTNQLLLLPALISYIVFAYEAAFIIPKTLKYLPQINISNFATLLLSSSVVAGWIYSVSTLILDAQVINVLGSFGNGTAVFIAEQKLISFLVFAAITAIGIDLSSLVIVSLAGLITLPVRLLVRKLTLNTASRILLQSPNLKIIIVCGNWHDQTTTKLLSDFLQQTAAASSYFETSFSSELLVAKAIINKLKISDGYLVINIDPATKREAKSIIELLQPTALIFTAHTHSPQLYQQMVASLPPSAALISSGNEQDGLTLIRAHQGPDIVYFSSSEPHPNLNKEPTVVEITAASEIRTNGGQLEFNLRTLAKSIHIKTKATSTVAVDSYLALICLGIHLGKDIDDLANVIANLPKVAYLTETLTGINNSIIIPNWNLHHLRSDNRQIEILLQMSGGSRYVLHTGYKDRDMRQYSKQLTTKLAGIDKLVVTDKRIQHKKAIYLPKREAIYYLQNNLKSGDLLLLLGQESTDIMNAVVNDNVR